MADGNPLLELETVPADLVRVEDALRAAVRSDDPYLTEVASHLILAGFDDDQVSGWPGGQS